MPPLPFGNRIVEIEEDGDNRGNERGKIGAERILKYVDASVQSLLCLISDKLLGTPETLGSR